MSEVARARYPKWSVWIALPFDFLGAYLLAFTAYDVLGIVLLIVGFALTWHFAMAKNPDTLS